MKTNVSDRRYLCWLMVSALGVVYGDIGTSPLYALRECFHGESAIPPNASNVLGAVSLIVWSLLILVTLKYLTFVMRANYKGEGGVLTLLSLAFPHREAGRRTGGFLIGLGIFGAALLYGDGVITPAITVLSAIEGLNVATSMFEPYVIPLTVVILIGLFSFQRIGTGKVGGIFGPIMLLWFLALAVLGINGIITGPEILWALHPVPALRFFSENGVVGFVALGAVFLAITGAEALYADMGHFGMKPIRSAWFALVLPALMLNYLGQGAVLLQDPSAARNPFYLLAPSWALYPMVLLATMAGVIASQALISGTFSLTMQAIQLGYLPRMEIRHTSSQKRGQIYLPQVNWFVMLACIGLVLGFQSSTHLAAAYGIAVSLTMIITTLLFYVAARRLWKWSAVQAALLCSPFLVLDLAFCGANLLKVAHGGWFPLVAGLGVFTLMSTWKTGRRLLREQLQRAYLPLVNFLENIRSHPPVQVAGTAVFMSGNPTGTPIALLHNLKHNRVLHRRTVILTIETDEIPHVDPEERVEVEDLHHGFYRVIGHYGFMEEPNVPDLLEACKTRGLECRPAETTYFLSRETIIATDRRGMALWRERLFAVMSRNAQTATAFFGLPANRVVELGMQVEL